MTWILKMLGGMKGYLLAAAGSVFAILIAWTKYQSGKIDDLEYQVEIKDAKIKHTKKVEESKAESQADFDSRTAKLAKEIEDKKTSSELSDPNQW